MQLAEIPLSLLFVFFLMLFVLGSIYPAWKQTAAKFKRLLREQQSGQPAGAAENPAAPPTSRIDPAQLDDFERLVLFRLARTPRKSLSRRKLATDLFFRPAVISRTLQSLQQRGLIRLSLSPLFGVRIMLSEPGRRFVRQQGYIVQLGRR